MTTLLLALATALNTQNTPVETVKPLPSASELADEMLEEAKKAGVWDDWVGSYLATRIMVALYDCGRADEAKRLALDCADETDRSLYLMNYAEVVTEREGASSEFEQLISNEVASDTDELLGQAIAVMVRRGKLTEAEQLFGRLGCPAHDDGIVIVRSDPWEKLSSGSILARALIDAGERERARQIVRALLESLSRWTDTFKFPYRLRELIPLAIELGESDALKKLQLAVEAEATRANGEYYLPKWFACSGRWWAAQGNQDNARRDFETAQRYEIATEDKLDSYDYAKLASQARLAGVADLADEWTNRVFLRIQEEPIDENQQLGSVVQHSLLNGDRKGADIYLAKITRPYERILGNFKIAELLIRNDDRKAAQAYLADATSELESVTDRELDTWDEPGERCHLLQVLAKVHHQLNDDQAAGKSIQQAARLVSDEDGSLWMLATTQIEIGRFQEAYATVHRISSDKDNELQENLRLDALAKLAAAYAKHEAEKRRN